MKGCKGTETVSTPATSCQAESNYASTNHATPASSEKFKISLNVLIVAIIFEIQ